MDIIVSKCMIVLWLLSLCDRCILDCWSVNTTLWFIYCVSSLFHVHVMCKGLVSEERKQI
jgi:hypothetical protein